MRSFMICTPRQILFGQYESEKDKMGRALGTYGAEGKGIVVFVGKPKGKRPLVRPCRRYEDNIEMDLREI
jgi:hypothetical protein